MILFCELRACARHHCYLNFSNEDAMNEHDGMRCKVRSITLVSCFSPERRLRADMADKPAGQNRLAPLLAPSTND
jgi:hypothetical protein